MKVMIVDDEVLIRIGLKSCIDWDANGFVIVGEAENGIEALELYKKHVPQIVLCDIKMPRMDGLQLIKELMAMDSSVKIIVLSYYDDFEYVKEALKSGAYDYILKSGLNENHLLEVLLEIKKKYGGTPAKASLETACGNTVNSFLNELLLGVYGKEEALIESRIRHYGIPVKKANLFAISVEIDNYPVITATSSDRDKYLLENSLYNGIREAVKNHEETAVVKSKENLCTVLASFSRLVSRLEVEQKVALLCHDIKHLLDRLMNIRVSIGVSNMADSYSALDTAYNQSLKALRHKFLLGTGQVIFFRDVAPLNGISVESLVKIESDVKGIIERYDAQRLRDYLHSLMEKFIREANGKDDRLWVCFNIISLFKGLMAKNNMNAGPALSILDNCLYDNIHDLFDCMANKLCKVLAVVRGKNRYSCNIRRAIDYMEENYSRTDLSLTEVAKHVGVSCSYLSITFKEQTGVNFNDYLMRLRLAKAKELLRHTNLKTYEIAESVGFNDSSYFIKVFKKLEGMSPKTYRDLIVQP